MKTESEIMSDHSRTRAERKEWAMRGSEEDYQIRKAKNPDALRTLNVFHRRMGGCSDTENKIIGLEYKDLPE